MAIEKKLLDNRDEILPVAKYNYDDFSREECVSFTGSPIKHPYDAEKFILICDPLSEQTAFFEFNKSDVAMIENLSSLLSEHGEGIHISRIWIKKGVVALRYEPFIVGKTSGIIESLGKKTS